MSQKTTFTLTDKLFSITQKEVYYMFTLSSGGLDHITYCMVEDKFEWHCIINDVGKPINGALGDYFYELFLSILTEADFEADAQKVTDKNLNQYHKIILRNE